jgi:hypothetical protein
MPPIFPSTPATTPSPSAGPYIGAPPTTPKSPASPVQPGPVGIGGPVKPPIVQMPNPQATPLPTPQTTMGGNPSGQIRATGPSGGFDPSYLQNLATSDAGTFARGANGLSFNPLGDLSSISNTSGGGSAPLPGIPNGMLTQALANNPTFSSPNGTAGLNGMTGLGTNQSLAQMLQQVFGGQNILSSTPTTS